MKKIVPVILVSVLLGACGFLPVPNAPTAVVGSPTTVPTETYTALPTDTAVPATGTFTSTPDVFPPTFTFTAVPTENLTTTAAFATIGAVTDTPSPASFPSTITASPTNGVMTFGTLPPAVPSSEVILKNRSGAEAYISLQNQAKNGAILEYPVNGQVSTRIPLGDYIYVAWVGGNKMVGSFDIGRGETVTIVLFMDRVNIQK
jgi:hypothetical protein